jgi:hypothetical protein
MKRREEGEGRGGGPMCCIVYVCVFMFYVLCVVIVMCMFISYVWYITMFVFYGLYYTANAFDLCSIQFNSIII